MAFSEDIKKIRRKAFMTQEDFAKEIQKNGWTFEEYCLYNNVMPEVKEQ